MQEKILIIDDDRDFVEAISLLLSASGFKSIKAFNGKEGLEKAKKEFPQLILLDIQMDYATEGLDIARMLKEDVSLRIIPIIIITGLRKDKDADFWKTVDVEKLNIKAIIDKPIEAEQLLKIIKDNLFILEKEHSYLSKDILEIVDKWKDTKGSLVMILHDVQDRYGYIPRQVSLELSKILNVPLARIYEVITFYNFFKLSSPGKHLIRLCMGTACYLKGAGIILEEVKNILGVKEGETTKDGLFRLEVVRCLGCCSLAPVVMIDEKVYGKVKKEELAEIISKYVKEEENAEAKS